LAVNRKTETVHDLHTDLQTFEFLEYIAHNIEVSKMIPTKKVSFLWENDIQIELRYIAAVLAISDNANKEQTLFSVKVSLKFYRSNGKGCN